MVIGTGLARTRPSKIGTHGARPQVWRLTRGARRSPLSDQRQTFAGPRRFAVCQRPANVQNVQNASVQVALVDFHL